MDGYTHVNLKILIGENNDNFMSDPGIFFSWGGWLVRGTHTNPGRSESAET